MTRLALLLLPLTLVAASPRYARLGEFYGTVEVQLTAAHPWMPAERNLPLMESTWVRTGEGSRLEVELDEGNTLRLGPNSQAEFSDYKRLSTGQRVTLLTLDRGVAYFTGIAEGSDAMMLAVPGAQVTISRGTRIRLEVQEHESQIVVIEGIVRFSSPAAELDVREGTTTRVESANPSRFFLTKEVAGSELDRWSEDRDKALAGSTSATHVPQRYGLVDLDAAGEWIQTDDLGPVWKPKTEEGWRPFQNGRWRWYDTLGYTWVGNEAWGWLPYHYGRWQRKENVGWIWAPSKSTVFKPGEVYWLRGNRIAGWGPLGPAEAWPAQENAQPRQYMAANTVWSAFPSDAAVLDPAGFAPPKEPLTVAGFAVALPSPAFPASKLELERPLVRAGRGRLMPMLNGVTFSSATIPPPPPQQPVVVITEAPAPPPPDPDIVYGPPVLVSMPNILIVNVPGNPDYGRRGRQRPPQNPSQTNTQSSNTNASKPATPAPVSTVPPSPGRTAAGIPTGTPKTVPLPEGGVPPKRDHPPVIGTREPAKTSTESTPAARVPRGEGSTTPKERAPIPTREKKFRDEGESRLLNDVMKNVVGPNYNQALISLDEWSQRYRASQFRDDRSFYYMQAYTGLNQPAKVLEKGTTLVGGNLAESGLDPTQIVGVLYLASLNFSRLEHPTPEQTYIGRKAATDMLSYLPECLAPQNKPATVTPEDWVKARRDLETLAKQTLARVEHRK